MIPKVSFGDRILGVTVSSEKSARLSYNITVSELNNEYLPTQKR